VRLPREIARTPLLLWFGLLGPPLAWTFQHVAGFALTDAACSGPGRTPEFTVDAWLIVVAAVGAAIALLGEIAAIVMFRRTRQASEEELPEARVHFMAVVAMTIGPLFLAIILMSGLGSILLSACRQS
jgi:hypothetical protein